MFDIGETTIGFPLPPPELALQVYVLAPVAVRVVVWPVQMLAGVAVTVSEGKGVMLTATVCVDTQPEVVPVTV